MTDIAEQGHCVLFRSQLKREAIVTLTVPMKPSLKPVKGPSVPSQRVIYLPYILLKPRLYFGF